MAAKKKTETAAQKRKAAYLVRKESSRLNEERKNKAGRDIGPIPKPKDLPRKAAALASFKTFLETYFAHRFYLAWSQDHLIIIAEIEDAVLRGGLKPFAMPRGSGKTSLSECACLWAALKGIHKFIFLIGSSREHALQMLAAIKEELLSNEKLAADFPEAIFPLRELDDRANRCKGQHTRGVKTKIVWGTDRIVLPTIKGSLASGAAIRVAGITGSFRGAKINNMRPSLVVGDDLQTDASAASLTQCEKRTRVINGAMLGLAGPGQKITVVVPCTVIRQGDVADTLLDRDKSPLWKGRRFKLLYEFPKHMSLWEQYGTLRVDEFRNGGDGSAATKFYEANKVAMDEGAVVAWPDRHKPDELSGIQHALNLFLADKWSFFAEYQNAPLTEDLGDCQLEADAVAGRISGLAARTLPNGCTHVTAMIDVQQKVLFYLIAAWSDDFTGSIIDYGAWPDQQRRYFTAADVQRTLARATPKAGLEGQIHAALGHCAEELLGRTYPREDGVAFKIERLLIDAGFQGDVVKQWCRTTHHAALVMPSHGHGITASGKPWDEYDRTRCEKMGLHWLIPKLAAGKKSFRHLSVDVNFWKSFVRDRLVQTPGDKGALTIWGKSGQDHKMLADHLTAEYWIPTEGRGRKLQEWRVRPGQTENHWWDCLIGSAVAASMQGCGVLEQPRKPPRKRLTLQEMAAIAEEVKKARESA